MPTDGGGALCYVDYVDYKPARWPESPRIMMRCAGGKRGGALCVDKVADGLQGVAGLEVRVEHGAVRQAEPELASSRGRRRGVGPGRGRRYRLAVGASSVISLALPSPSMF